MAFVQSARSTLTFHWAYLTVPKRRSANCWADMCLRPPPYLAKCEQVSRGMARPPVSPFLVDDEVAIQVHSVHRPRESGEAERKSGVPYSDHSIGILPRKTELLDPGVLTLTPPCARNLTVHLAFPPSRVIAELSGVRLPHSARKHGGLTTTLTTYPESVTPPMQIWPNGLRASFEQPYKPKYPLDNQMFNTLSFFLENL